MADGESITVHQTDGSQMSVELCGIDALEVKKGKIPGQPLSDQAKEKSAKALAQSCGCLGLPRNSQ
ncbi:MAG: hypothetical protein V7L01_29390 [Nostoc sp.]